MLCAVVVPVLLSTTSFFFATECSLSPDQPFFWVLFIPVSIYVLLDFYAFSAALLISLNKQFGYLAMEYSVRSILCQHIVLTLFCIFYNLFGLFALFTHVDNPLYETALNSALVFIAIYVFIWTNYFSCKHSIHYNNGLWMNNLPKNLDETIDPQCQTPLLLQPSKTDVASNGKCINRWMPDIIPSTNEMHQHFVQSIPHPKILSPPVKILHHETYNSAEVLGLLHYDSVPSSVSDQTYNCYSSNHYFPSSTFSHQ